MDTVEPGSNKKAVVQDDHTITSDGTTVLGADDVSGIVSILEAARVLKKKKIPHRSIEILFTFAEEVYIKGSGVFDYSVVKAKEAYVLDLDGPVGTAAYKAPTLVAFTAEIIGKAAHAGFARNRGSIP
jgi:tripeptide aminopeptidase